MKKKKARKKIKEEKIRKGLNTANSLKREQILRKNPYFFYFMLHIPTCQFTHTKLANFIKIRQAVGELQENNLTDKGKIVDIKTGNSFVQLK